MLKIKQEASGYPSWVKTDTDKDNNIAEYYVREGIKLDKSKIQLILILTLNINIVQSELCIINNMEY